MNPLFPNEKICLDLPDAVFEYYPHFLPLETANNFFKILLNEIPWQQDDICVFGKNYPQPRLTALFGNEGKSYKYSNIIMNPHPWNAPLLYLKQLVEQQCHHKFTTILLNLYRNERDSNGWHADNEKELGRDPIIASLSFGEERTFQIKHNSKKDTKQNIVLKHGSLILMKEGSQIHYKHQIPKATSSKKARINLTFRTIL